MAGRRLFRGQRLVRCPAGRGPERLEKTAIGFAHCADARAGIEVIGVTSAHNHAFTHALGCYDEVVTYDEIPSLPVNAPLVSIDMAGNGPVLVALHEHCRDHLRHSMAVGRSHHDAPGPSGAVAGPKPTFFFAPAQVKKRVQDWGPRDYQQRVASALHRFVGWSKDWLHVQYSHGPTAAQTAWQEVYAGRTAPDAGRMVSLW